MRLRAKAQAVTGLRPQYPLAALLKASGLARSTYYYRPQAQAADKHAELKGRIGAVYAHHKGRYGYRRITATLRRRPVRESQDGAEADAGARAEILGTPEEISLVSRRPALMAPNLLARQFVADRPNQKWVTDVTEFNVRGQKLYLSPVMDLYNGEILAYETSRRPMFKLVGLCSSARSAQPHRQTRLALRSGLAVSAVQLPSDAGGPIDNAEHVTQKLPG